MFMLLSELQDEFEMLTDAEQNTIVKLIKAMAEVHRDFIRQMLKGKER